MKIKSTRDWGYDKNFVPSEIYWEHTGKIVNETLSPSPKTMVWHGLSPISNQINDSILENIWNHFHNEKFSQ